MPAATTTTAPTMTPISASASLDGDNPPPLTNFSLAEGKLLASSSSSSANSDEARPTFQIKEQEDQQDDEEILIKPSTIPVRTATLADVGPKTQLMKSATIISRSSSQVPRQSSVSNIVQQTSKLPTGASMRTVANQSKQPFLGSAIIKSAPNGEQTVLEQPTVTIKPPGDPYSSIKSASVTNKPAPNLMLYAATNRNNTKLPLVINHAPASFVKVQPNQLELATISSPLSQIMSSSIITPTQTKLLSSLSSSISSSTCSSSTSSSSSSSFSPQPCNATPSSRANCNTNSNRNKQPVHQAVSTKTNIVATNCMGANEASASNILNGAHRQLSRQQTAASDCDLSRSLATAAATGNGTRSTPTTTPTTTNTGASPNAGHVVAARLMDMGKKLLDATRDGQIDQVRQLVVNSGAPFTSDWLGTTALHLAAQHGHVEIAQILLRGGVNRDARTKLDRTALHLAAQVGCVEVVDLLLINGSDVNARDMLKMTPLHWAVERGYAQVAERLLINGADVSARSKFQLTPIDMAQSSDCYEMVELFKNLTNKGVNDMTSLEVGRDNCESQQDLFDNYHLTLDECNIAANNKRFSLLDADESCIDLVELEWSTLKFEPDFFLSNDEDDDDDEDDDEGEQEPKVEHLMKVVEELQKENRQLKQKVQQLSTNSQ